MKDERDIPVVPYLCYDALMERFERSQKNLRYAAIGTILMAITLFVGVIGNTDGNRNDS